MLRRSSELQRHQESQPILKVQNTKQQRRRRRQLSKVANCCCDCETIATDGINRRQCHQRVETTIGQRGRRSLSPAAAVAGANSGACQRRTSDIGHPDDRAVQLQRVGQKLNVNNNKTTTTSNLPTTTTAITQLSAPQPQPQPRNHQHHHHFGDQRYSKSSSSSSSAPATLIGTATLTSLACCTSLRSDRSACWSSVGKIIVNNNLQGLNKFKQQQWRVCAIGLTLLLTICIIRATNISSSPNHDRNQISISTTTTATNASGDLQEAQPRILIDVDSPLMSVGLPIAKVVARRRFKRSTLLAESALSSAPLHWQQPNNSREQPQLLRRNQLIGSSSLEELESGGGMLISSSLHNKLNNYTSQSNAVSQSQNQRTRRMQEAPSQRRRNPSQSLAGRHDTPPASPAPTDLERDAASGTGGHWVPMVGPRPPPLPSSGRGDSAPTRPQAPTGHHNSRVVRPVAAAAANRAHTRMASTSQASGALLDYPAPGPRAPPPPPAGRTGAGRVRGSSGGPRQPSSSSATNRISPRPAARQRRPRLNSAAATDVVAAFRRPAPVGGPAEMQLVASSESAELFGRAPRWRHREPRWGQLATSVVPRRRGYKKVLLCDKTLVSLDYLRSPGSLPPPPPSPPLLDTDELLNEIGELGDNFLDHLEPDTNLAHAAAATNEILRKRQDITSELDEMSSAANEINESSSSPPLGGGITSDTNSSSSINNNNNNNNDNDNNSTTSTAETSSRLESRRWSSALTNGINYGNSPAQLSDDDTLVHCDMWDLEKGLKSRKPPEQVLRLAVRADFDTVREAINRCGQLSERGHSAEPHRQHQHHLDEQQHNDGRDQGLELMSAEDLISLFSMKRGLIPGTKWCGLGDQAASYNDLGPKHRIDICCRAHDHCPIRSKPFRNDYGVLNIGLYTKSHCDCDADFYRCLREVRSRTADMLGNLYFNVMKLQCMREERLKVCREMKPIALGFERCVRYEDSPVRRVFKFTTPPVAY